MLRKFFEESGSEAKNVNSEVNFDQPPSASHKESMAILKSLGYDSIADARVALNNSDKVPTNPLLERMIRTASNTAGQRVSEREISNVVEFPNREKPVVLGESELIEAEAELLKLQDQKKHILLVLNKGLQELGFGKSKSREFNNSMDVKKLPEINEKIHKLESDITLAKANLSLDAEELDKAA